MLLDLIAEAIWKEDARQTGTEPRGWADAGGADRERFMGYAKAALSAVVHPTPSMVTQGNRALQTWEHSEHYRSPVDGIYHAMIAAELPPQERQVRQDIDEL